MFFSFWILSLQSGNSQLGMLFFTKIVFVWYPVQYCNTYLARFVLLPIFGTRYEMYRVFVRYSTFFKDHIDKRVSCDSGLYCSSHSALCYVCRMSCRRSWNAQCCHYPLSAAALPSSLPHCQWIGILFGRRVLCYAVRGRLLSAVVLSRSHALSMIFYRWGFVLLALLGFVTA